MGALVSQEATKAVYWGSVIESTFETGSQIQYVGPGNDGDRTVHVYGEILAFEPSRTLSFTHYAGESYQPGEERYRSRITYTLEPIGATTKLTLLHDEWNEKDPSYKNSPSAWRMILISTKSYVETGKPLVFDA